jgi:hypothetical protein
MKRHVLALSFGLGAMLLATHHAFAQEPGERGYCAPHAVVTERLAGQYGETRQSIGLSGDNQVVELFASTGSGTWTIVVSTPAGLSCILAAGQAFANLAEHLPPAGNPA